MRARRILSRHTLAKSAKLTARTLARNRRKPDRFFVLRCFLKAVGT